MHNTYARAGDHEIMGMVSGMGIILLRLISPAYTVRQLGTAGLGTVNSASFSQVFPGEWKKLVGDFATFFLL
jgi:hypothetical protein